MTRRQTDVDVSVRIHRQSVRMARLPLREHLSVAIANADIRGRTVGFLLADVKDAILVPGNVVGAAHTGPHADEISVGGKNLHAPVAAVADIDLAVRCDHKAVRQMKVTGLSLAGLAP